MEETIKISVSQALKDHYEAIIRVRDEVINDPEAAGNAKSAILNSTTAVLKDLAKIQVELYNSELVARLVQQVFNALDKESPAIRERVAAALEVELG